MENNSTKTNNLKEKKQYADAQLEFARAEWQEKQKLYLAEKEMLGHGNIDVKTFLSIDPEAEKDSASKLKMHLLQKNFRELEAERVALWPEEAVIEEFNRKHAIVHFGQTYVLTEKINVFGSEDFTLESRQSFVNYYEDEVITYPNGMTRKKTDIWLKSPLRRKYSGIVFEPSCTNTESLHGHYNIWKGFARKALKGNCALFWAHVRDNICNKNEEAYRYVRKWLAYVFQHPDKVHTALVLCGSQGVGKNSFVEPLGVLLGQHYILLSSIAELVSNFNYHLKNAVLIHANEALWGGNRKELGTVKAMITERTCLIEGKGKDRIMVNNYKHVILSSNEDWPVHLDPDDRRFFVLLVSESHKEDHAYFKALQDQLDNGGYEALLYDLLNEDLTGFKPQHMPTSTYSFEVKMRSSDSAHRYILNVLEEGGFSIGNADAETYGCIWQPTIPKSLVYTDYSNWCYQNGERRLERELFGKVLKKLLPSVKDTRTSNIPRLRSYQFQSLEKTREEFCKAFKETMRIFEQEDLIDNEQLLPTSRVDQK